MTTDDEIFRWIVAAAFAGLAAAWYRTIRVAGVSRETFYTRAEGPALAIPIRGFFISSMLGTLIYVIHPQWMAWGSFPLFTWARWMGIILTASAFGLYVWSLRTLGRQFGVTLGIKKDHALVTGGPYHWVRHPQYTELVLLWVGFLLLSANWFIGVTGLLTMAITISIRTPMEEEMLLRTFGDDYRTYMQRTGRFFPRLFAGRHG